MLGFPMPVWYMNNETFAKFNSLKIKFNHECFCEL